MGRARKRRITSCSLTPLSAELSAVINRVRRAFGPVSMAELARHPEIFQAEQEVALVAGQVARGEQGKARWAQVLVHYEGCWMSLLSAGRTSRAA